MSEMGTRSCKYAFLLYSLQKDIKTRPLSFHVLYIAGRASQIDKTVLAFSLLFNIEIKEKFIDDTC